MKLPAIIFSAMPALRLCPAWHALRAGFALLGGVLLSGMPDAGAAQEPVSISVDVRQPARPLSPVASGLSYETSRMLPDADGGYYFRPDNAPLVQTFRTLGIKSLRIGGNSVDDPKVSIPAERDVRSFFEFARVAGVKVIYSVRLQEGDPQSAARFATLIRDNYADVLDCFAIGNEPGYYKDYTVYTNRWTAIRDAMVAVWPEATFCGPDQNPDPKLIQNLVRDFGNPAGRLVRITQHSYSFGCSYKNPGDGLKDVTKLVPFDPAESREKMLSPSAYGVYEKILNGMVEAVRDTPVSFRMTEVNSFWFSGLEGASDRRPLGGGLPALVGGAGCGWAEFSHGRPNRRVRESAVSVCCVRDLRQRIRGASARLRFETLRPGRARSNPSAFAELEAGRRFGGLRDVEPRRSVADLHQQGAWPGPDGPAG